MKRALWIINHKALLASEVPILHSLGLEVYTPKIVPDDVNYRSAAVEYAFDSGLSLRPSALAVLNNHRFYEQSWSSTITTILNEHFDVIISAWSSYTTPIFEAIRKFEGLIIARPFGREFPRTYSEYFDETPDGRRLIERLDHIGDRFVFGQGYANLADIENDVLKRRARTLLLPLLPRIYAFRDTWSGSGEHAIFLCPGVTINGYYSDLYAKICENFGDLPHRIFGRQERVLDNDAILPYMSDDDLVRLYAAAPVFAYPSTEPRHVHFSPIEAMVVGTPVLYLKNALIDALAREPLPGRCADVAEMRLKIQRLVGGDRVLSESIRRSQRRILTSFSSELARDQWSSVLNREPLSARAPVAAALEPVLCEAM